MENTRKSTFRSQIILLPTYISIIGVLVFFGLLISVYMNVNNGKQVLKEQFQMSVYLRAESDSLQRDSLGKALKHIAGVKDVKYTSKEQGLIEWQKENGVNEADILGFNPIPDAYYLTFLEKYIQGDSLKNIKANIENSLVVREAFYKQAMADNLDKYARNIGLILSSITLLLGIISVLLIYQTVRITLYSKRYIIKSMQLVGATASFIRRPFIVQMLMLGVISGITASFIILFLSLYFTKNFEFLPWIDLNKQFVVTIISLTLLGAFISSISAYTAINKYLRMKIDDLI
ncbi:MAG: permease-like cell division protein FtsX [Bacteroidota bacterium]|nr:permease-like cell division protein FtsX [Bacteroidota bacterium]